MGLKQRKGKPQAGHEHAWEWLSNLAWKCVTTVRKLNARGKLDKQQLNSGSCILDHERQWRGYMNLTEPPTPLYKGTSLEDAKLAVEKAVTERLNGQLGAGKSGAATDGRATKELGY